MKRFFTIVLVICFIFTNTAAFASQNPVKFKAQMCESYNPEKYISDYITFRPLSDVEYGDIKIPMGTLIKAKITTSTKERRMHKSAYLIISFEQMGEDENVESMEEYQLDGVIRKYDKIDKKDAAITSAELTTTTAAAFIIPGIDIVYYFTKGFIQNEKAETRFKSGVHNAYDNSIMWFFLKGKPINLSENDLVSVLMCDKDIITVKPNKSVKIKKVGKGVKGNS